ncbi:hypothetical protein [Chelativorans intermedius]|uniref:Periplasmic heavy metal sensor n=1 Tax=Chelativorans intermedius TaxID=515947 RepID=A0ABV6DBZ3_9HYPH|nr:hypothetical protein [Chelativorans intermedius]MCT9000349.1 hypothetical protein [Chelativorans intermedius]
MLRTPLAAIFFLLTMIPSNLLAQDHQHSRQTSPYAGFESRKIKSLSGEDIAELKKGAGWSFALPAELNGLPGPSHLLALKDEIGLSAGQVARIEVIYSQMKTEAIAAGDRFIAAEWAIENAFARGQLDTQQLRVLVDNAAAARADLRFVHLSRHLSTPPLLTDNQIKQYNVLRGYMPGSGTNTPESHDGDLGKRHSGSN